MRLELVDKIRVNCQIADQGVVIGESKDFLFRFAHPEASLRPMRNGVKGGFFSNEACIGSAAKNKNAPPVKPTLPLRRWWLVPMTTPALAQAATISPALAVGVKLCLISIGILVVRSTPLLGGL
jgi:hypothetical protein